MIRRHLTILGAAALSLSLTACQQRISNDSAAAASETISITTAADSETVKSISALGLNSSVLPSVEGVTIDENAEDLAPVNLTIGVINSVVSDLQQRLMDLGFMDSDEPTTYYGEATSVAVQHFQRQAGLPMDGICGVETWDAIMSDSAPHYAVSVGTQGDDVSNIQQRLYDLGYLANADQITGTFTEDTKAAVEKLQTVNNLTVDGTVGVKTVNLLYSDEIKANFLALGEKSDLVKKYQERLIQLGYMTGEADGSYGNATVQAVQKFQSRNDQVVDGYLGPGTRTALDSPDAKPFAIRIGDESDEVKEIQNQLVKYGYLSASNATGYYGELTANAVTSFQSINGLSADGTVGISTYGKLTDGTAKKKPASTSSSKKNNSSSGGSSSSKKNNSSGSSSSKGSAGSGGATVSGSASALISIASSKIGSPYVWGAKGPNSFDCSGFVYWCLNRAGVGVSYMTSSGWRNPGRFQRVSSFDAIRAGDIVVVSGHVGIAAGGGTVIDASSSNGRVVHRSLSSWWRNNFIVAWRIFG